MRRRGRPLVRDAPRRAVAVAVFLLAFAVRAYWTLHVQAPLAAVRGDMAGYVSRADGILNGTMPGDPRVLSFWPWGTHALIALDELRLTRRGEDVFVVDPVLPDPDLSSYGHGPSAELSESRVR